MLAALGMRTLSEFDRKNHFSTTPFRQPVGPSATDAESIFDELQGALDTAVIITYAQGLSLLAAGSDRYGFEIDLAEIVGLWRGCCGIRPALLDEIISVLKVSPNLPNLLCDADLSEKVMERQESLRHAVRRAETLQKPVPALLASLDYLDFHRDAWLPGNLIQVPGVRHVLQMPSRAVGLHAEWNHR
jgi:6-phosphogluconate dehydrogenase